MWMRRLLAPFAPLAVLSLVATTAAARPIDVRSANRAPHAVVELEKRVIGARPQRPIATVDVARLRPRLGSTGADLGLVRRIADRPLVSPL